jgi:hypothetical protein
MDDVIDISLIVVIASVETVDNSNSAYITRVFTKLVLWIKPILFTVVRVV